MVTYKMKTHMMPGGTIVKVVWETDPQSQRGLLSDEHVYVVVGGKTIPGAYPFGKKAAEKLFNDLCALVAN